MNSDIPVYSNVGSYVTIAGLVVLVLNHFGITVVSSDVETIVGSIVTIYGVIHQYVSHRNLAITTGTFLPKRS